MMFHPGYLILLGILSCSFAMHCPRQKTSPGREIVCYTSVSDIGKLDESLCRCTTLVHRGHDVRNLSTSDFEDLRKSLKEVNPAIQFMLSLEDPAKILRTSALVRQEATARIVRILKEVDGVELNVTAGSKDRLFQFVKGLRDELVKKSYDKRLFLVLPTKAEILAKQFVLKDLAKYVDLFTVATHYLVEDDESYHTFHPSRLMGLFDMINTDSLIDFISGLGAPKRKILVSVPSSGYRFTLADKNENAPRSPTSEKEPVVIDRKELCDSMNKGEWTVERDEDLTAPYAFKNTTWIAFEDNISLGIKGKYILLRELPGIAVYDIENDLKTDCSKPVTHEIHHSFTDFKRKSRAAVLNALEDDLHQSQITYPNHVKSSDFRVVRVVDTEGHIRVVRENTQTEFTCSRQGYFVHPKSCNRFYRCVKFNQEVEDYSVFEFDCPAGLAFDEKTEVCVWPGSLSEGSPCPGSSEIAPVTRTRFQCPSQPGYYADPQNPRWFFACMDLGGHELTAYEFRCPYGLVFDEHELVCEWPWLVQGYTGTEHTKTEYDYRGYSGGSSTQGTGGYVTGGIPDGFSRPPATFGQHGAGGYGGVTVGPSEHSGAGSIGGHGSGSGFSGASGVGYQGSTGIHAGSAGHGGGSGYAGAAGAGGGSEYSGGANGGHAGSSGYGGGSEYSGGANGGHAGSSGYGGGSGYSGGAGGAHAGSSGYGGGSGYSGGASAGHAGGSEYSGGASGGHAGSSGYGGESGYSGGASAGHAGGSEYSGGASGGHAGSSGYGGGSGYSGGASGAHAGSSGYGGGSEYSGGSNAGHAGGSEYSGAAGGAHAGSSGYEGGSGYSGSAGSGHSISTGTHTGSVGHDYSQVTNTGYPGSTVDSHAGSDASLYSGTSNTRYSGSTGTHTSSIQHGYSGTSNTGYTGSTVDSHAGTDSSIYSGAGGNGYTGSTGHNVENNAGGIYYGSNEHGYSQTTGTHTGGSGYSTSGSHTYSGSSGINGYSGAGDTTHGTTTGTGYSGSTGTVYTGQHAGTGSIGSGYVGVNSEGHQITTSDGHQGTQYSGTGSTVYNGAHGNGYSQSGGANQGSGHVGGGYLTPGRPTGSVGHGEGGYTGSSGVSKSTAGNSFNGFTSSVGYTGSTGTQYENSGYPGDDTGNSQVSIHSIPGLGSYGQPTGTTIIKPGQDLPSVNYLPSTPSINGHSGALPSFPNSGQGFITGGHVTGHGTVDGTFYRGQSDFTHTYSGSSETTDGYITKGVQSGSYGGVLNANGQNVTLGFGVPAIGSRVHGGSNYGFNGVPQLGGTGTIITGDTIHGSITTSDSASGLVLTRGDTAGTVLTGSADQGTIVTGSSHPGYSKTGADTPGYVINNGVKTTYPGGASPGTFIHGTAVPGISLTGPSVPGIAIKGQPTPGILLTGQTAPGVSLGGSIEHGTVIGNTNTQYSTDTGYTTYHSSNGLGKTDSRTYVGTAKTGTVYTSRTPSYETNEYHDNGGRGTIRFNNGFVTTKYAESDIPDYRPAGGAIPESVLPGGVDQSGVRVTARPTQEPNYSIGKSDTPIPSGFTKTGPTKTGITTAQLGGRGSYVISNGKPKPTINPEHIGAKAFEGNVAGYTKTSSESSVNQGTYSTTVSTQSYDTSHIDTSKITLGPSMSTGYSYPKPKIPFVTGGLTNSPSPTASLIDQGPGTTPASYLNIEVYNNPTLVDSAPITASPAVVNTYSYSKPADDQYQGAVGRVPTEFNYRKPATPTATPTVTYTSEPVGDYKTTAFEAARIPVAISTAQPVSDTGYKFGTDTSYQQGGYGDRKSYVSVTSPSPSTVISPISVSNVGYQEPSVILQSQPNYVHGTASTGSGYSYESSKSTLTNIGTSRITGSRPQTQYIPADVSPAIGVTYRKPFPVPGITYQQSTSQPETSGSYDHTGSSDRTSISSSYSKVNYPSDSNTRNGGSPTNLDIPRDEVGKLITNYDRGTVKYTPSAYDTYTGTGQTVTPGLSINNEFSRKQTSSGETYVSTSPPQYGRTPPPPAITTYSGGYSRPSSVTAAYEVTTKPTTAVAKGKVIVKWSDLHPLLLGKLGAECTCRGDPFANLRGPGKKLIDSSRGKVDLSNYDESEIYVDLEKESGSYEDGDYVTTYDSSPSGPLKVMNSAGISVDSKISNNEPQYGKPSTSYLPSRPSTTVPSTNGNPFLSGRGYELRGTTASSVKGKVPANGYVPPSGHRAGKNLNIEPTETSVGKAGAGFDRYGPGGLRGFEETLDGIADCARPGLFRHPNLCNKFYACHWDQWKKRFTLHVFNCPVHLTFDSSAGACNWPSKGPACQDDNLLV